MRQISFRLDHTQVPGRCASATLGLAAATFAVGGLKSCHNWLLEVASAFHVILNNGTGAFCNVTSINGVGPRYVTLADMNADAKLDIIGGTTVLLGGWFRTVRSFVHIWHGKRAVRGSNTVTGDFDGDSNVDIASVGGGSLSLLLGDGKGGIRNAAGQAERGIFGATRADMNSDGKPDFVYFNSGSARIMLGDGAGGFGPPLVFALTSNVFFANTRSSQILTAIRSLM